MSTLESYPTARHEPSESSIPGRVAVIDDHRLVGESLAQVLRARGFLACVADGSASEIARLRTERLDLAVLDLQLGEGVDTLAVLRDLVGRGVRVVMLSASSDDAALGRCIAAGALGVVAKAGSLEHLVDILAGILAGEDHLSVGRRAGLVVAAAAQQRQAVEALAPFARLSRSESEVLVALSLGKRVGEVAQERYVSVLTVRAQIRSIFTKLGVHDQLGAVSLAHRTGWLAAQQPGETMPPAGPNNARSGSAPRAVGRESRRAERRVSPRHVRHELAQDRQS